MRTYASAIHAEDFWDTRFLTAIHFMPEHCPSWPGELYPMSCLSFNGRPGRCAHQQPKPPPPTRQEIAVDDWQCNVNGVIETGTWGLAVRAGQHACGPELTRLVFLTPLHCWLVCLRHARFAERKGRCGGRRSDNERTR